MSLRPKYWVVGANWEGDDQAPAFYRRGYWEMGWSDAEQPKYVSRRTQIGAGDRIAVKRMDGRGADTISILALGLVKEVGADGRVYIDWLITGLDRSVPARGCFGTIHGPFEDPRDTDWIDATFRI